MKLSIQTTAAKILPSGIYSKLNPHLGKVDAILTGTGDSAVSGRIALFAFSIRILSAAIAYFSQVFLARWMGEFEYGIFVAVWVAAVILGGIACLGFQTGIIRFISEYQSSNDQDHLRGAIVGSLSWALLGSSVVAILGCLGVYYFQSQFTDYYIIPIYLAAICLPMLALQEVQDGIARAHNWPNIALTPTFILRPIAILVIMISAILLGFEATAPVAMISTIIATFLASIGQFIWLKINLDKTLPKGPRKYVPAKWLAITIPIFLIEGFYNLLTNMDILFVSLYMRPEDVSIYFAAVKTLALVHFVYFAVKAASAHRFSTYLSSGNMRRYEQFIQETVHWTFWPSLALALVMLVVGKYFLMLFGENFASGESLIWILAIGIIARATVGPAESVLTMSGEQKTCALVYVVTLVVNLVLNWKLIPLYGLDGAAIATSSAMIFEAAALYAASARRLNLHIFIIGKGRQSSSSTKVSELDA